MDLASVDPGGSPETNFDIEMLTCTADTDLLIRQIKSQAEENASLKRQLSSFTESALEMKRCYKTAVKKNDCIERQNKELELKIKCLNETISQLQNKVLNSAAVYEQQTANVVAEKTAACRKVISQGNVLRENHLSSREFYQYYIDAREFLQQQGEDVPEVKVPIKKKKSVNVATMTEPLERKEVKTFCEKSTMCCSKVSTATRGTSTSTLFQKADAATNFPEALDVEVENILRLMLNDTPRAVSPVESIDVPAMKTVYCQTEVRTHSNRNVSTMTSMRNVRRKINYISEQSRPSSPTLNAPLPVKKEKSENTTDFFNFEWHNQSHNNLANNRQLTSLWQMFQLAIFSKIESGGVFSNFNDLNLINSILNQIRSTVEMQQQGQFRNTNELSSGLSNGISNISPNASATSQQNNSANISSYTQSDPMIEQSNNSIFSPSFSLVQSRSTPSNEEINISSTTYSSADSGICLQTEKSIETPQWEQQNSTEVRQPTSQPACTEITTRPSRSVPCEEEATFKKPINGIKRKLFENNFTVRKHSRQTKMFVSPKTSQLQQPMDLGSRCDEKIDSQSERIQHPAKIADESDSQLHKPKVLGSRCDEKIDSQGERIQHPAKIAHESDDSLVEAILRYYKMPKFVEPIIDSTAVIEASTRFDNLHKRSTNSEIQSRSSKSIDLLLASPTLNSQLSGSLKISSSSCPSRRVSPPNSPTPNVSSRVPPAKSPQPELFTPESPQAELFTPESPPPELFTPESPLPELFTPESPPPELFTPESPPPELFTPESPPLELFTQESPPLELFTPESPPRELFTPESLTLDSLTPGSPPAESPPPAPPPPAPSLQACPLPWNEFESPKSPPSFTGSRYDAPTIIPLSPTKVYKGAPVKSILQNFDERKRLSKSVVSSAEEEKILTSARRRLERCLMSKWTVEKIDSCVRDLSQIRPAVLAKCFIEIAMNTKNECLSKEFTPPAPALPKSHQKLIVLIKHFSRQVNRFEHLVLYQLERTMFVLAGITVTKDEGLNLAYLFIGLTDCMYDESEWSCVLFMYKCLYYFSNKAIPIIYTVLLAYPNILPIFTEGEDSTDFLMNDCCTLQATFVTILKNTSLYDRADVLQPTQMRKRELDHHLKGYYKFSLVRITFDEFVDGLLSRFSSNTSNSDISYALILIAKRNPTQWANRMIQEKLVPLLNNLLSTISSGPENDGKIIILISTISSIIKSFPVTDDITNYRHIFHKVLELTKRQTIQEAAVMALLRTSRFGTVDIYKRICDWTPPFAISRKCYVMLKTFLYRYSLSYWKQL